MFVVEGVKLLGAALAAGAEIESVFLAPGATSVPEVLWEVEAARAAGARVFDLDLGVMERIAATVTPQPVIAVTRIPCYGLEAIAGARFVVVCVDVRDPGNLGAVMRVADAAGAGGLVCCEGTADPYSPKTVRAAAGSLLHLPVIYAGPPEEVLTTMASLGLRRLAASAHGGQDYSSMDLSGRIALVLGNEARGLPAELGPLVDAEVTVPMAGRAESLNVSAAAAVICFEALRQRSTILGMEDGG